MEDIEISRLINKKNICDVAKKIGLSNKDLILYGDYKAKIKNNNNSNKFGKLILVTAINPTPYGEGKTTISIGLNDALNSLNKKSLCVLRQPSMGPVFGIKGGATGGGYSQVVPMEDINLHFTGDFHAITSANNLLCAAIDNHIYHGNDLGIKKVVFNRCLDVNDRALRNVKIDSRNEKFNITAASEIMALFCLASSLEDLKYRLGNIIVGYNKDDLEIYAKDLKIEDSLLVILKEAFMPNLVQSLENNPVLIHGGPFANIAHGCNSLIATKTALSLTDYVVTEAGFGADLGAEKFFDIKCRQGNLNPSCVVLTVTIKALKYNSGVNKNEIFDDDPVAVFKGLSNLDAHIENLNKYGVNYIVCLNKFNTDYDDEMYVVEKYCNDNNIAFSISDSYNNGGKGSVDLASKVVNICNQKNNFNYLYDLNMPIIEKIKTICKEIYHADDVIFSDCFLDKVSILNKDKYKKLPICISKTQYSISDDPKKLGNPRNYKIYVNDFEIYNGAGFIIILLGKIIRMPGLPKKPNYEKIRLNEKEEITGLS